MTAPVPPPQPDDPTYPEEVRVVELGDRRIVLVGTAHVSQASVELVRQVILAERPDRVAVELDAQRYEALSKKQQWQQLDLKQVIRRKGLVTLLANLLLASYQKRLAGDLGVEPGAELLEATRVAAEIGVPIELADRDVRVTLRRAARAISPWRKLLLLSNLLAGMLQPQEITAEDLEELKRRDALSEILKELGAAQPELKRVLIDERDVYLAERTRAAAGERIVSVIGAGHLDGVVATLEAAVPVDLAPLETVPPPSAWWKVLGWGIPVLIVASIVAIGWTQGFAAAGDSAAFWFVANAVPSMIGAALALAHPLTILTAGLAAPFTSLTPVIGAGYVTAFVQAWLRPPLVQELQTVMEDAAVFRRWWSNRLLRIFLAFLLPGFGSMIGTWIGGVEIFRSLVSPGGPGSP